MSEQKLYMIPMVIADDTEQMVISDQVKHVIQSLDYFLVENVRTARRYISKLRLGLTIEELTFEILDRKTSQEEVEAYFANAKGKNIGILSESGCPGIADPGAVAAAVAHRQGRRVVPLSGPSSIFMALMGSGFNGQSFVFHGYVPIDNKDREKKLKDMEDAAIRLNQTQLFMDTPYRNQKLFEHLIKACHPNTLLSVAKGITGDEEYIATKTIGEWKREKINLHKTPTIFSLYA
ncbi:SAM-dependent methyltransferase [Reichenbachiella carrageenanivorans]|uniref:SAM-dependent methyltransferase n=1 Tax=Reichenbachiella carrageenanivorans TaxID=2979869 RepID=A0ABY6D200_9BACT|nr:SAM-dependent methyltransferase [Reichenbachiella carrageenanivorans]UXX80189.1 SAM-dependent methyltransferase [Reichenbachiella carrageenanivorans]